LNKPLWFGFLATLPTSELEGQLSDILSFAAEYRKMVAAELNNRRNVPEKEDEPDFDEPDFEDYDEIPDTDADGSYIDYYAADGINRAVESYSEEELRKRIAELEEALSDEFTAEERAVALFEKEQCEFRLFSLIGETEEEIGLICENCGSDLREGAAFCPKCGAKQQLY